MFGSSARSSVIWLIGGLVAIALLVGFSAALRSRSGGSTTTARSAASAAVVGGDLLLRNVLPVSVSVDAILGDPFYEGRDTSSAAPQVWFSRRELRSGAATVGSVDVGARSEDNVRRLVEVTRIDGPLIGSFELEWGLLGQSCATRGDGSSATQDCEGREGWWLAGLLPASVNSDCPGPVSRVIGSLPDLSGAMQRVEVVAECSVADGTVPVSVFEVRLVAGPMS